VTRSIQILYDARDGGPITNEECAKVNEELATLDPADVPDEQIDNVLSYLDRQFLYQQVEAKLTPQLERIIEALQLRIC